MVWIINIVVASIRILLAFTKPISDKILDIVCTILYGRSKQLPAIKNEILLMSATQLAKKIRKRQLTAAEVMRTYIKRIEAVQPIINAFTDKRFIEAIADAELVDRLIQSGTKSEEELANSTPLLGVPFSCKDIVGVKDLSQTCGLKSLRNRKADFDSDAAAKYKKAGAIPVVVTNIPTLALWMDSDNPVYGRTKNPYDNKRTPGGSSGGEGALISSAGSVIGIGSDLGGSIRIPSSFCGIYGHKPSRGIISNKSSWPIIPETLDQFWSTGPMCRYVQDLKTLVKVLLKDDVTDIPLEKEVDFRKVKIFYLEEFPAMLLRCTDEIKASVRTAVSHFETKFGTRGTKLNLPALQEGFALWQCKVLESSGPVVQEHVLKNNSLGIEFLKYLIGLSDFDLRILYFASIEMKEKDEFYRSCLKKFDGLQKSLEQILDGDAILILPTYMELPPHPITTIPKFFNIPYTMLFSVLGYPVTQVPAGLHKGLPVGLQVIATLKKDHLTLAAAKELDNVFGGWKSPSPVSV